MKVALLDVNVLIALAWPNHVHHELSLRWFKDRQPRGWATCPATQTGFVRVSSNRQILPNARSPEEALLLLRRITALPYHEFWTDDIAFADSHLIAPPKIQGHRQVSDAHLLALVLSRDGCLATLDRGVRHLVPDGYAANAVVCSLIP